MESLKDISERKRSAELQRFLLDETIVHGYSNWNFNIQSALNWHRYEHIIDEVSKILPRGLVLDVGCGFGQITEMMRLRGIHAIGLDLGAPDEEKKEWRKNENSSDASLKGGSRQNKVWNHLFSPFILGDGCTLPFASGVFDAVVCCGTLEHVYDEQKFLGECRRVLKNNAPFLCYYLPNKTGFESLSSKYFFLPTIHKFYDRSMISNLFSACGFEVFGMDREHIIPDPHFLQRFQVWRKLYKTNTLLDDALVRTRLRFFGDNWRVYARKTSVELTEKNPKQSLTAIEKASSNVWVE